MRCWACYQCETATKVIRTISRRDVTASHKSQRYCDERYRCANYIRNIDRWDEGFINMQLHVFDLGRRRNDGHDGRVYGRISTSSPSGLRKSSKLELAARKPWDSVGAVDTPVVGILVG